MKIKIEPERFRRLLEAGMIFKGKPCIDPVLIRFSKDNVLISDPFSNVIGVHMEMSNKFFSEYESKNEVVSIPYIVLERLGWGFKDEFISVSSADNKVFIKGEKESFDVETDDLEPKGFPFTFKNTDYGIIPEKIKLDSAVKIDAKELKLPPGKAYYFELKGKKLTVRIPDSGNFTRKLEVEVIGDKDIKTILNGEYYSALINNLDGKVTFIIDENISVFAEKGENYNKTFLISPMVEES